METTIYYKNLQKALDDYSANRLIPDKDNRNIVLEEIISGKYNNIYKRLSLRKEISNTEGLHYIFKTCEAVCKICMIASGLQYNVFPMLNVPKFITFLSLISISTDKYIVGQNYTDFILSILKPEPFEEHSSFYKLEKEAEFDEDFQKRDILDCIKTEAVRFRKYRTENLETNTFFKERISNKEFNPSTIRKTSKERKNDDYASISNYKKFDYTVNYFLSAPNPVNRPTRLTGEKRAKKKRIEGIREKAFDDFWNPIFQKHIVSNPLISKEKENYYNCLKISYRKIWKQKNLSPEKKILWELEDTQLLREALEIAIDIYAENKNFEYYLLQKKFFPFSVSYEDSEDTNLLIILNRIQINYVKSYLNKFLNYPQAVELILKWEPIVFLLWMY